MTLFFFFYTDGVKAIFLNHSSGLVYYQTSQPENYYSWNRSDHVSTLIRSKMSSDFGIKDFSGIFDAICYRARSSIKGTAYFFQGSRCWGFENSVWGPSSIRSKFGQKAPTKVDACLSKDDDGKKGLYFFKTNEYWRYNFKDKSVHSNDPRKINQKWRNLPNNLDAAVYFPTQGYVLFFKGKLVYRYSPIDDQVESGYPKPASELGFGMYRCVFDVFMHSNMQTRP